MHALKKAVDENNVDALRELRRSDHQQFYGFKDEDGCNLLHLAVKQQRREAFDYLLSLGNYPLNNPCIRIRETALMVSLWKHTYEGSPGDTYFALELIRHGASVNSVRAYTYSTALHWAVQTGPPDIVELLIKKGADVNVQDFRGNTPLHHLTSTPPECFSETIAMLLFYGADPQISNNLGDIPFDLAVFYKKCEGDVLRDTLKNLLYYTFDKCATNQIKEKTLLMLARIGKDIFAEVLKYPLDVIVWESYGNRSVDRSVDHQFRFQLDCEDIQLLIDKCNSGMKKILGVSRKSETKVFNKYTIQTFQVLFESNLRNAMIEYTAKIEPYFEICTIILQREMCQTAVTELVMYLLSYGLSLTDHDLQDIYLKYGYCDLFRWCLHMDTRQSKQERNWTMMPALIIKINLNLHTCLTNSSLFSKRNMHQLFHYFADYELKDFFHKNNLRAVKGVPTVPCLIQLSRDVLRNFFIQKLQITTHQQFYCLVNALPIGSTYKKIITYETPLYLNNCVDNNINWNRHFF